MNPVNTNHVLNQVSCSRTASRFAVLCSSVLLLVGCGAEAPSTVDLLPSVPVVPGDLSTAPSRDSVQHATGEVIELENLLPSDAELTGVAIGPNTSKLYVLDARRGVYELEDGRASLVFDLQNASTTGADGTRIDPPAELTDVAAIMDGTELAFVVTAENDGFIAYTDNRLESHFCYLPGWEEASPDGSPTDQVLTVSQEQRLRGVDVLERTEAIAVHPITGDIYAQPRTHRVDNRAVLGSELFVFDSEGGDSPYNVQRLEDRNFVAGGMVVESDSSWWLAQGSDLFISSGTEMVHVATVDGTVTGMALDEAAGQLIVLDGLTLSLQVLDYSALKN